MTQNNIILTDDGSHTIFNKQVGENYHSAFGAIQESKHVFIEAGLDFAGRSLSEMNVLEIGFGTGLNALLTMIWAENHNKVINYFGVESNPISEKQAAALNYPVILGAKKDLFLRMHQHCGQTIQLTNYFKLLVHRSYFEETELPPNIFNVIFFDAFSPEVQPELWTQDIFNKIAVSSKKGAVLTTYSCKGNVKRALKSAGFRIEKLPGPPGKREILRAVLS